MNEDNSEGEQQQQQKNSGRNVIRARIKWFVGRTDKDGGKNFIMAVLHRQVRRTGSRRLFVAILLLSLYYDDYYYNEGNKNHRWASKGQEAGKRMGGLVGVCKRKTKHAWSEVEVNRSRLATSMTFDHLIMTVVVMMIIDKFINGLIDRFVWRFVWLTDWTMDGLFNR